MKKMLSLFIFAFFALQAWAQKDAKSDVILKTNGDELTGKVTEIADSDIKFIYAGETLVYTIKKSDILKITFSSGRIEFFNRPSEKKDDAGTQQTQTPAPGLDDHRNKVAILPFKFIADKQSTGDDMGYEVQTECYTFLGKHAGELTILDPRTTNALLIKAGATEDKIRGFTMSELCGILGVEYVIDGTITQNKTSVYSSQSQNYKVTDKSKDDKKNANVSGYSSASTTQNYQTNIALNIYTDADRNIFNENRQSFWQTADAYKNALQYLLKRCPLYRK